MVRSKLEEYHDFVLQHSDWMRWHEEEIKASIQWYQDNALVIEERDEAGELQNLSLYVATVYPEGDFSRIKENLLGCRSDNGTFLYCGLYVKRTGKPQWLKIKKFTKVWLTKYPNIKEIYYQAYRHDGKLVHLGLKI